MKNNTGIADPPEGTELFIGSFYLSYIPEYLFYTINKIVVELRGCNAHDGFKKKWVGKHIKDVKADIAKLYKTFIHHEDWRFNKNMIKLVDSHSNVERNIEGIKSSIKFHLQSKKIDDKLLKQQREYLAHCIVSHDEISKQLNVKRAEYFGETEVDEYFKPWVKE